MVNYDIFFMDIALQEAWRYQGLTYPNPAVGAVVAIDNCFISKGAHTKAGAPHAEVEAIKEAYYALTGDEHIHHLQDALELHEYLVANAKDLFHNATIYVTLEPCNHFGKTPPCSLLIKKLGFQRVAIGVQDPNEEAAGGASFLRNCGIQVDIGIQEERAKVLIEPFLQWRSNTFTLFKLAQTLNGVIDGGIISCEESRRFVHALRDKIDLLVIGGNTVRTDRPILDARMVGGKAPDILIYSRNKKFDNNIPLFHVPNRKVFIEETLDRIKNYRYVMIEGGEGMLEATKDLANWYLFFVAPVLQEGKRYQVSQKLRFLHQQTCGTDTMIWSKNG
ncbi:MULTISPECIES: bifunctional diaminohydroxyphosphoribosylaminopyrimidine deaminase/5-amino-6-(5-phosphoribosylamino)uracil reductase RibD [unclassified Nitratiruptor]|uniref:bifunctional diaminohydroxyphosphoribosylaminopyrimidine deaminase/5-amino-6-(5-phosphoribosylamino)uracil reductase RibD n=1 Tax=unclassified Nitratiruptor TaxID=2624044 RepID=UPI001914FA29|nr:MULTISPECIES: bifunctional diaminohydroxyphosphoribosylaminopyrimidine deaminase/5-amino-6-(5-phosphoribosylamino)uracil reductase RibD [unclassified Nitratiruptor]BCD59763.1 diaminohydroxyphosphoribosylaminopyrimidine deaminase / 5-amino-6-(5-phosphoribosylamino)uracil reductase [Nitratiruptor sp. YY08-10]BCD63687.1 diaminohydroxyphosphoribosylaminopyrimidine deaminase / 5-amino-6-(5-phosphoribosylamino)uracil reductase [Nitratiruptor sp. YY08-14]